MRVRWQHSGITSGALWSEFADLGNELTVWCDGSDLDLAVGGITVLLSMPYEQFAELGVGYGDTVTYTPELGASATVDRLVAGEQWWGTHDCGV